MRWLHILYSRIRSLLFPSQREDDLDEELRLHIDRLTEEGIAQGVPATEARRRARRAFGNVESLKEESRDARGVALWDHFARDLRHAATRLRRDWRFSVPAVVLLALGIGANTAIFSVVNATLFRPLPFADAGRLVDVYQNMGDGVPGLTTYPAYVDMTAATDVFARVMMTSIPFPVRYRDGSGPVRNGAAEYATVSYPDVLGIQPSRGRWFIADEARQGAPVVAVIGHQAWTTRFAADPDIVGRTINVQGVPTTIVGVGPEGYRGTIDIGVVTDFWMPIESGLGQLVERRRLAESPFLVKARLRDGVTVAQAQAAMTVLGKRLATDYPDEDPGRGISVFPTKDVRVHPQVDIVISVLASVVLAVVGLVLALACSNLATLLLVRAAGRAKEVSVRLAIGATRWQVVRHLLAESLLLSLTGGLAGAVVAWWAVRSLRTVELPVVVDFSVDATVLVYTVVLSVVTGVLFGLAPALKSARLDLLSVMREDGLSMSSGRRWFTMRNGLVAFQVTVSVVLLTATGAFLQMSAAMRDQPVGYAVDGVAWIGTDARYSGYTPERSAALYEDFARRVGSLPGVQAVTVVSGEPMERATVPVVIEGAVSSGPPVEAASIWAAPGFFDVMQIPILFGRAIDERDRRGSAPVAVITESMAKDYFGDANALGRRFRIDQQAQWFEVIGVTRDTSASPRDGEVGDSNPRAFFRSAEQADVPGVFASGRTIAARTSAGAATLVRSLQRELLQIDPSLPTFAAATMSQRIEESRQGPATVALVLGALGALGLVLAGVGLYAVIAFAVSRRVREIGIRMALGAGSGDVVRGVAKDVAAVLGAGAAIGMGMSLLVILAMRTFSNTSTGLVNIDFYKPNVDPLQILAIVVFVILVGIVAAFVPSRRALRVDPLAALRHE